MMTTNQIVVILPHYSHPGYITEQKPSEELETIMSFNSKDELNVQFVVLIIIV